MLLAQMVVEYASDTSKLVSGVQAAAKSQKIMQDAAASASSSMSSGFKNATSSVQALISKADAAGLNVSKLASAQAKAGQASAQLGVAQARAATAVKNFNDMAASGKASAEKLAVAEAQAALAAERVKVAEVNAANAMKKVADESKKLEGQLQATASKSSFASSMADGARGAFSQLNGIVLTLAKVGLVALVGALIAVGAYFVSSVQKAANFEESMRQIYATTGITKQQMDQLGNELLKLGPKVGKGPQDLAEGLYYVMGAGYDSAKAMDILTRSAKAVAGSATATTVPANALTAVLKAFPGISVAKAMDMMTVAVATGKTEWATFGPSIGKTALFAQMAGANFGEASAALSTLTNTMPSTEQAATSLISLFQTTSAISNIAKQADDLGLAFDKDAYSSMNFIDRLKYLQQMTNGNAESMKKLLGQEEAMPAIQALLTNGAQDYAKALDGITNSAGAADEQFKKTSEGTKAAWARAGAALESLQIKIGTALLPVVNAFSDKIAPMIMKVMDWADKNKILENAISTVSNALNGLKPVVDFLAPKFNELGGAFGRLRDILAPFVQKANESGATMAVWQGIVMGLAVAVVFLVSGLTWLVNGLSNIIIFFTTGGSNAKWLWDILVGIGNFLTAIFKPAWDQLVTTFQTQVLPAWNDLVTQIQPLMPALQYVGMVIAGTVVVALVLLAGAVVGVVKGFAMMLPSIIQAVGGVIQFVSGFLQIILGIIAFFVDLSTGHFERLGADLTAIWGGIVRMFQGGWNMIQGIWNAGNNFIIGLVTGFVSTIVSLFMSLYNRIVGHSIIPDMVNGIVNWMLQLPGRAGSAVSSMASTVLSRLSGLASSALSAGSNIVNNIAQGIRNAIGNVGSAISSVAQYIKDHLPHSPAKIGPLRYLAEQGGEITNQIATGMIGGLPALESAIGRVTTPIALGVSSVDATPAATRQSVSSTGGNNDDCEIHIHVYWDGQDITNRVMVRMQKESRKGPIR